MNMFLATKISSTVFAGKILITLDIGVDGIFGILSLENQSGLLNQLKKDEKLNNLNMQLDLYKNINKPSCIKIGIKENSVKYYWSPLILQKYMMIIVVSK